jgi:two-component system chemotaxis response regulator CheB
VSGDTIRVLVVDDSAFARKVVREVLTGGPGIEVIGTARDGLDAIEKIAELRPDVVTLDLVMPNLDGIGVLLALGAAAWHPAVVVVSMADEDSELGVEALALGAFDVVKKPTALANDHLYELRDELRAVVLAAAREHKARIGSIPSPPPRAVPTKLRATGTKMVVIGASTGGPQALTLLVRALPSSFPVPIAIVLHMPAGYTEAFAKRLDGDSALDVMEARDGLPLRAGLVVVARAGMHLLVESGDDGWICRLDVRPLDTLHRPAVDVLFSSAARHVGAGALGVVLTGMGSDGQKGAEAIRAAGGRVLTEAESSCVVYGMPRSVFEAGLANAQAPLEAMSSLICEYL